MSKTLKALALVASLLLMGVSAPVMAQTAAATPAATAAPTVAAPVVKIDGLVDAYYSYNFTGKPFSFYNNETGGNYNAVAGNYQIGLAELKATATQGGATAVVELAYQDDNTMGLPGVKAGPDGIGTSDSGLGVLQAYASYNTGNWTFTGGRFVTWMGNEVVESTGNWNYSHSLLFTYTIPVWDQGINVSYAFDPTFSLTAYATNGWNNTINNAQFNAQTFGLEAAWTPNSTWKFVLNAIDGPGPDTTIPETLDYGFPQDLSVGELIVDFNPASDVSLALDAEYGMQDLGQNVTGYWAVGPKYNNETVSSLYYWGIDLYGKWQVSSDFDAALRLEMLDDPYDMFYLSENDDTETYQEITLTLTKAFTPAWTVSLEGRYDWSDVYNYPGDRVNPDYVDDSQFNEMTATLSTAFVF